jgi:hypothetical protein
MTVPAVYRIQVLRVGESLIIGIDMTRDAAVVVMDRMGKNGGVHIHRNRPSIHGSLQTRVFMAHHAILIGLRPNRIACESGKDKEEKPDGVLTKGYKYSMVSHYQGESFREVK